MPPTFSIGFSSNQTETFPEQRLSLNDPPPNRYRTGRLIGVGVGPGDPGNLTLRAIRAIKEADLVIAPCSSTDTEGRAESIVRNALPEVSCQRIIFDMSPGETGTQARVRGAREAALGLHGPLCEGKTIAFVTLGDPNVFSTFSLVAKEVAHLLPETEIRTIPGIMAFQEVASMGGLNLLDETEKLFLVTAREGTEDLDEALGSPNAAIVIYKGGRHLQEIKAALDMAGRLKGAVVGEMLGLEGETISDLDTVTAQRLSYLATVIAPPLRKPEPATD